MIQETVRERGAWVMDSPSLWMRWRRVPFGTSLISTFEVSCHRGPRLPFGSLYFPCFQSPPQIRKNQGAVDRHPHLAIGHLNSAMRFRREFFVSNRDVCRQGAASRVFRCSSLLACCPANSALMRFLRQRTNSCTFLFRLESFLPPITDRCPI